MMTNDTDFGPSLHKPFLARMYDHAGIVSSALQNSVYWLLDHGCRVRTQNREEKEKQVTQPTAVSLQHDLPVSHTEQECLNHLSSNQTAKTHPHSQIHTQTQSDEVRDARCLILMHGINAFCSTHACKYCCFQGRGSFQLVSFPYLGITHRESKMLFKIIK